MAYFSSTVGATGNPPMNMNPGAGGRTILGTSNLTAWSSGVTRAAGIQTWRYISTNLSTDLFAAGFFTDGYQLGMQVGDVMIAQSYTSAGSSFILIIGTLTTTNSTNGWNLSTGGTITSTFA